MNRNITSITYNELNLPSVITFSGNRSITYGYDAAGNKLSVAYLSDGEPTKMEYAGNRVYNNNMMTTLLTDEGYIDTGTTPAYHYHLKDHQGNNRVVVNQAGTVEEVNHYYPFGGVFSELARPSIQRYKYNGKELDRKFDLDMLDYGARHYDPALGRWFTVDPMAEAKPGLTLYHYCSNNPINKIDIGGNWDVRVHVHKNRETFGYGFLYVTDNKGNIVFRATVGVEGSNHKLNSFNHRDRTRTYADTPTGTYEILGWSNRLTEIDRGAYGPNDVLELNYIEGEALRLRNGIHLHGGRQEGYGGKGKGSMLKRTHGCIRIYDEDILEIKKITANLEINDPEEKGNYFYVIGDLIEVDTGYKYPRIFVPGSNNKKKNNEDEDKDNSYFDLQNWIRRALRQNPNIKVYSK
ncbi:RHS repeat-associated core domain-containing protein [Proteiniphilum sp.]|uniref:RHS repeat-associated core domain-containing protein n=1 Tax=Proteiniphilum sp. TaxID=1926877 RepID=UPI002B21A60A|nr:RHS repeat-associated core domain-containing protein [Proteiniphilum sp.]MEA4918739.1 RHS repeat-associated core domain-containing protein [Proteiniphilum sp.]